MRQATVVNPTKTITESELSGKIVVLLISLATKFNCIMECLYLPEKAKIVPEKSLKKEEPIYLAYKPSYLSKNTLKNVTLALYLTTALIYNYLARTNETTEKENEPNLAKEDENVPRGKLQFNGNQTNILYLIQSINFSTNLHNSTMLQMKFKLIKFWHLNA